MSDLSNKLNMIQNSRDDIRSAILSKGQTVTNDIRTFANAVLNINGGGPVTSGIKQFSSIESMQADLNPFNDGLAIVYSAEESRFTEESQVRFVSFPATITLPEAVGEEEEYYAMFIPVNEEDPVYVDGNITVSASFASCEFYSDHMAYSIYYSSEDGINYTRTDFYDAETGDELSNPVDLKTLIKIDENDYEWSDLLTYFMYNADYDFEGLFQYSGTSHQYKLAPTQLDVNKLNVYGQTFYGPKGVEQGTLSQTTDLDYQTLHRQIEVYSNISELSINNDITNMEGWFTNRNIKAIPKLDLSTVTNLKEAFYLCENLTDVAPINLSNAKQISNMFAGCSSLANIAVMDLSNAENTSNMFFRCSSLTNASYCNIANSLPLANQLINGLFVNIGINVSDLPNEAKDILLEKGYLDCDYNFDGWSNAYNINGVEVARGEDYDRYGNILRNYINALPFETQDISVGSIGNDDGILLSTNGMFDWRRRAINIDLSINTSNVIDMYHMFNGCENLTIVPNFDTGNVRNFSGMFNNCQKLTFVPNYDLHSARDVSYMFSNMNNLTTVPDFDTSNVTDMSAMLSGCRNITNIPNFNTSNVTDMGGMLSGCSNLTTIPDFDTSNVTRMPSMFAACHNITTVPNLNTSNVTDMWAIFRWCNKLTTTPNLDTSNVTNMQSMFEYCNSLTTGLELNTNNAIDMGGMFSNCTNLSDIPQYNTADVINMTGMFKSCNNLSNASIQNIINMCLNSNVTNAEYMNLSVSNWRSPLYGTIFDSSYYSNRLDELLTAGWTY